MPGYSTACIVSLLPTADLTAQSTRKKAKRRRWIHADAKCVEAGPECVTMRMDGTSDGHAVYSRYFPACSGVARHSQSFFTSHQPVRGL
ncbi:hypothetical protein K431DRAFT_287290 [Polychaeton citri CBS 116435]|uniref:Uncharacterized protein n=1 Tax=Polychaeton citri CBS 116435 TaxID=1314669 RepID=A0A9P4UMG8_9PEZI|nr:hypothetical protein K431DRAFT_287290 [Polychaeton citri CBS 116435]